MNKVAPQSAVTMRYTLATHLPDGTVKERPEEVTEFIFKVDQQTPTIEEAIEGARTGDEFRLTIPSAELYGEHDPELIRSIPKEGLIKQRLKPGRYYRSIKRGSLVSFKVLEVREDSVLADFNKPMAGVRASIKLNIDGVREADEEEIERARQSQKNKSIGCG